MFQFTRPQGARHLYKIRPLIFRSFNSRAHRGRDLYLIDWQHRKYQFQFTRPQGARLSRKTSTTKTIYSFNSRAHRGRDSLIISRLRNNRSFNSRAHKGRDSTVGKPSSKATVSIHAPTRGATQPLRFALLTSESFNSRAHKGRDLLEIYCYIKKYGFNSRAHKGRDLP